MKVEGKLGAMLLAAARQNLPKGWLYLAEGPLTVNSDAVLIPYDSYDVDEDVSAIARQMGFPVEGLDTDDLEQVCESALHLQSDPDDQAYLRAFLYFLKFDAFLPGLNSGDPPSNDERDRAFFDSLGEERLDHQCRREGCVRGSVMLSVFCRVHHFQNVFGRPYPFDEA